MTIRNLLSGLLTVSLSLTTGCAAMLNSGPSTLDVTVEHPTQAVTTTVTAVATKEASQQTSNAFQVQLDKGSDYILTMQSPGYRTETMSIARTLHPAAWADLLLLVPAVGLLGLRIANPPQALGLGYALITLAPLGLIPIAEWLTHVVWTHDPHQVQVRLIPESGAP